MNIKDMALLIGTAAPMEPAAAQVVKGRVLSIDGDMLCYQCGGSEDTSVAASRNMLRRKVDALGEASGADRVIVHLTASGSLKGDRALVPATKPYQQHRVGARRPKNWGYLRDWLGQYGQGQDFEVREWFDREADDAMAYCAVAYPEHVIATKDKDLRMAPGWHIDWDVYDMHRVEADEYRKEHNGKTYGFAWFLQQMLQGDTADGIRGLGRCALAPRGCGEATARKLLAPATNKAEGCALVVDIYKQTFADAWADEFAQQAALLWIRRGRSALLDEFRAFLELPDEDAKALAAACLRMKQHVATMKKEAAAYGHQAQDH